MKNIVKTFGLLTAIAMVSGAFAAAENSRVGIVSKSAARIPSAGVIRTSSLKTVIQNTSTGSSLLDDTDCIDSYTDCLKGGDACGSDFEDCTTSVLLHAKMPGCISTLMQCKSTGVDSLFGVNNITTAASDTGATTNAHGEITEYKYPTSGSVLGQMIAAAKIENALSMDQCVKKYTKCLQKDSVCGENFELCTSNKEFKKQAVYCASTLERCKSDGKTELFGSTKGAESLMPDSDSRLRQMILSGGELAANNAVSTCYRVTDQCVLNACKKNPNKCIEGVDETLIRIADSYNGGRVVTEQDVMAMANYMNGQTKRSVNKYLESECSDTIATNKYCYMVAKGKNVDEAKLAGLSDDEKEEIFSDIYSGTDGMSGRFSKMENKIVETWDEFNADVQQKCVDTIASCAMRSCGGGIGSVCYKKAKASGNPSTVNINSEETRPAIAEACAAVVGTSAACQYSARFVQTQDSLPEKYRLSRNVNFNLNKDDKNVFDVLFPQYSSSSDSDPIGVIGVLNSTLATSYNDAAIADLKEQCKASATACVKSVCGKDYAGCYRNRTDVTAALATYNTGATSFDKSMNKVGGVLDYNIVIGLCLNRVTSDDACNEHLKIVASEIATDTDNVQAWKKDSDSDRYSSVRGGWLDANSVKKKAGSSDSADVVIACAVEKGNGSADGCSEGDRMLPINGECKSVYDEEGCKYTKPIKQSQAEYVLENAGKSLFQELLSGIEFEAQQLYNQKLIKEQNICINNENNKGIMGSTENGSVFQWVKLKKSKVPGTYAMKGLQSKEFQETGDLYGAFCRARITVMSDDKSIQDALGDKATAYFAVGDSFTCGSWIDQKTLEEITKKVGEQARKDAGEGSTKEKLTYAWSTIGGFLGGGAIGTALTESGTLKGLLEKANKKNSADSKTNETYQKQCKAYIERAENVIGNEAASNITDDMRSNAESYASSAYKACKSLGADDCKKASLDTSKENAKVSITTAPSGYVSVKITDEDALMEYLGKAGTYTFSVTVAGNTETWKKDGTDILVTDFSKNGLQVAWVSSSNKGSDSFAIKYTAKTAKVTADALNKFKTDLSDMKLSCESFVSDSSVSNGSAKAMRIAVPIATAVAGGALGAGISASVLQAKYETAENEAIKKWMDEVGSHIQCYLGSEELGSYGDVISFSID